MVRFGRSRWQGERPVQWIWRRRCYLLEGGGGEQIMTIKNVEAWMRRVDVWRGVVLR